MNNSFTLDQQVENLFKGYSKWNKIEKQFGQNPNDSSLRENIPGPDGNPMFRESSGEVKQYIGLKKTLILNELSAHVREDNYNVYNDAYFNKLDAGKMAEYHVQLLGEGFIKEEDVESAQKTIEEEGAKKDKADKNKIKDSTLFLKAIKSAQHYLKLNNIANQESLDAAVTYVNSNFGVKLASIFSKYGQKSDAISLCRDIAAVQKRIALTLAKESSAVKNAVKNSIAENPIGYARSAQLMYTLNQ